MGSNEYKDEWSFAQYQERVKEGNNLGSVSAEINLDEASYLALLEDFVREGKLPDDAVGDPIYDYLLTTMRDPALQLLVMSDEVRSRIFVDEMVRFVDACLRRFRFNFQRKQAEMNGVKQSLEWSLQMKQDGWDSLITGLSEYDAYGFRSAYYQKQFSDSHNIENEELWESLYNDYMIAMSESLRQQQNDEVAHKAESNKRKLDHLLHTIPEYLVAHAISSDDFQQAWGMMGGDWNEYDFERLHRLVEFQRQYPQLATLANIMGRVISPEGDHTMWVGTGGGVSILHSSRSDIQGITSSNRLDSLLPLEMVQMADDELQELFLLKYATSSLQNFLHKSEQLNPNKHLERKRAKQAGPMIACIDTSGSMAGIPSNIARSLILRLLDISRRQHRPLFVIAFSVSARPIDAQRDRMKLLDFFAHEPTGNTDATKMLQQVLALLQQTPTYMSADVVLIGDFRMPLVSQPLLDAIRHHRQQGTYFYGLQLGAHQDNIWTSHFDTIFKIPYNTPRKIRDK